MTAPQDIYAIGPLNPAPPPLADPAGWRCFRIGDLFELSRGRLGNLGDLPPGDTPVVSSTYLNNGVYGAAGVPPQHPPAVTVAMNGTIGETFYQPAPFAAAGDIGVLRHPAMDPYAALFVCTVIRREKYRYSYGRKWNMPRLRAARIRLPAEREQPSRLRIHVAVHQGIPAPQASEKADF